MLAMKLYKANVCESFQKCEKNFSIHGNFSENWIEIPLWTMNWSTGNRYNWSVNDCLLVFSKVMVYIQYPVDNHIIFEFKLSHFWLQSIYPIFTTW